MAARADADADVVVDGHGQGLRACAAHRVAPVVSSRDDRDARCMRGLGVHVQNAAGRVMLVASHERRKRQLDMRPIETSQPVLVAHIESDSWIGF